MFLESFLGYVSALGWSWGTICPWWGLLGWLRAPVCLGMQWRIFHYRCRCFDVPVQVSASPLLPFPTMRSDEYASSIACPSLCSMFTLCDDDSCVRSREGGPAGSTLPRSRGVLTSEFQSSTVLGWLWSIVNGVACYLSWRTGNHSTAQLFAGRAGWINLRSTNWVITGLMMFWIIFLKWWRRLFTIVMERPETHILGGTMLWLYPPHKICNLRSAQGDSWVSPGNTIGVHFFCETIALASLTTSHYESLHVKPFPGPQSTLLTLHGFYEGITFIKFPFLSIALLFTSSVRQLQQKFPNQG